MTFLGAVEAGAEAGGEGGGIIGAFFGPEGIPIGGAIGAVGGGLTAGVSYLWLSNHMSNANDQQIPDWRERNHRCMFNMQDTGSLPRLERSDRKPSKEASGLHCQSGRL